MKYAHILLYYYITIELDEMFYHLICRDQYERYIPFFLPFVSRKHFSRLLTDVIIAINVSFN